MNREELDVWFARADDVLSDWHGSKDAMVARVDDEGTELLDGDSYYDQEFGDRLAALADASRLAAHATARFAVSFKDMRRAFERRAEDGMGERVVTVSLWSAPQGGVRIEHPIGEPVSGASFTVPAGALVEAMIGDEWQVIGHVSP